jgi:hypothetical protein
VAALIAFIISGQIWNQKGQPVERLALGVWFGLVEGKINQFQETLRYEFHKVVARPQTISNDVPAQPKSELSGTTTTGTVYSVLELLADAGVWYTDSAAGAISALISTEACDDRAQPAAQPSARKSEYCFIIRCKCCAFLVKCFSHL